MTSYSKRMCRQSYFIVLSYLCCIFISENYASDDQTKHSNENHMSNQTLLNLIGNNELWMMLLKDCQKPSLTCVQNNVYKYFFKIFEDPNDVEFTSYLNFSKNNIDYNRVSRSLDINNNSTKDKEDDASLLAESPIESISRSLQDHTTKFLMTHDVELALPDGLFPNSVLKISPRDFGESGTLVNLQVIPKDIPDETAVGEGRLFKKLRQAITERLTYALIAILIVVKLLVVKFIFIVPLIVGAATAKKLLLKVLLFIFPALHHLFKFCAYYPIQAKYHHHKHLISHIHKMVPSKFHPGHVDVEYSHGPPPGEYEGPPEFDGAISDDGPGYSHGLISHRTDPTRGENEIEINHHPNNRYYKPHQQPHRSVAANEIERMIAKAEKEAMIKAQLETTRLRIRHENLQLQEQLNDALKYQEKLKHQASLVSTKLQPVKGFNSGNYLNKVPPNRGPPPQHALASGPRKPPIMEAGIDLPAGYIPQQPSPPQPPSLLTQPTPYNPPISVPSTYQAKSPNKPNSELIQPWNHGPIYKPTTTENKKNEPTSVVIQPSIEYDLSKPEPIPNNRRQENHVEKNEFIPNKNELNKNSSKDKLKLEEEIYQAASITFDPFYSPILEKIDRILHGLGFIDENCKDRLICSMYKNPSKFSPHSNLLSVELSRDTNELQKPFSANSAAIRFYKYVQAARDGQDQRDCIRLYSGCAISTE